MNTIQFIADCLAQTHIRLMATCDGLTAEQMAWRPAPTANNIGFILWHLTRNEDARISRTAGRQGDLGLRQDLWVTGGWFERFGQPENGARPRRPAGTSEPGDPCARRADFLRRGREQPVDAAFLESLDDSQPGRAYGRRGEQQRQTLGGSLRHCDCPQEQPPRAD